MPSRAPRRRAPAGAPGEAGTPTNLVALHRGHFFPWQPSPIISLASSSDGSLAVAVREDGDIELYDLAASTRIRVRCGLVWEGGLMGAHGMPCFVPSPPLRHHLAGPPCRRFRASSTAR